MALIPRRTDEQKAEAAAAKAERQQHAELQRRSGELERARRAFYRTPGGKAREAYDRGDHVFQYAFDVMQQEAIVVAMRGAKTSKKTRDPVDILNSVCHEGWELVNGSFVFVELGQESRDKFMRSGQDVAVKGTTVGYYLFKRCEANLREVTKPWELPVEESAPAGTPQQA